MDIYFVEIILGALGVVTSILGWLVKLLWGTLRSHHRRIDELEKDMAVQKIKLEAQEENSKTLRDVLEGIDTKLDTLSENSARTTAILERLPCSSDNKCAKEK